MRIAITTSVLRIPSTYFVVDHAQRLRDRHDFRVFALAARVEDPRITVPIQDFGLRSLPFGQRMRLAPFSIPALGRAVRAFAPDLVHQHFATWCTPAVSTARSLHSPLITTLHGYDVMLARRPPTSLLERWHHVNIGQAQRHSARFLAVSEYLASVAVTAGFDANRVQVHYQGVDTDFFTPENRDSSDSDAADAPPLVLFVGSLTANKGPFDLVAASRALAATTEHRLVIVGSGPLAARLAAETAADDHIQLVGSADRAGIRQWMRRASVAVLPATEHNGQREAAGLVLLEAQACGTPVVAYASGGTPEMVAPENTGGLVPEGDVLALADGIRTLLALTAAEYASLARSSRDFVVEQRSLGASAEQLATHYGDVSGT